MQADQGRSLKEVRAWLTPNLENLPFHRAKTAVHCVFAGQLAAFINKGSKWPTH